MTLNGLTSTLIDYKFITSMLMDYDYDFTRSKHRHDDSAMKFIRRGSLMLTHRKEIMEKRKLEVGSIVSKIYLREWKMIIKTTLKTREITKKTFTNDRDQLHSLHFLTTLQNSAHSKL